ncbi:hypothetical protein FHS81_000772 [Pseudochelatococcus contaminans]|uniref:Uncharacterized protein n=1 Tax=Pseudochelatococcus contaminans TaxID=1538103 RepID=A0A7W5Z264_9HYPH|nr:hypothetical protein [Pseudochelatococcus contaminans]
MRDSDPDAWADAADLDRTIRTGFRGFRGEVYWHRSAVPLDAVDLTTDTDRGQLDLWLNECEGRCGARRRLPSLRSHGVPGCPAARE